MIKPRKLYTRKQLMVFCEIWGLTNVELFYHKSEGWTIYSDQFNDWTEREYKSLSTALTRFMKRESDYHNGL